jgi:peroxiredoxin
VAAGKLTAKTIRFLPMRLLYATIPLSIIFTAAGAWLLVGAKAATPNSPNSGTDPVHPVTPEMATAAAAFTKRQAPDFALPDPKGKTWTLKELTGPKPLFIYFILDGCPCSTDAEPLFHSLYARFKGKVNFVGVIGSDGKTAASWAQKHDMPYTILADPKLVAVHAYDAKHSVYNALVTADGRIEKMWPGYSAEMLKEVNSKMAALVGEPEKPFDPAYAPLKMASGCFFPKAS